MGHKHSKTPLAAPGSGSAWDGSSTAFDWCRKDSGCPLTQPTDPIPGQGRCTTEDEHVIMGVPSGNSDAAWGKKISDCGHEALNILFGINQGTFNSCLQRKVSISTQCASCYADMAEYDFKHCKFKCLFSWCSEGCIQCNKGSNLIGCIGFTDPQPTVCDGSGGGDNSQTQSVVPGLPGGVGGASGSFGGVFGLLGILVAIVLIVLGIRSCRRQRSITSQLQKDVEELKSHLRELKQNGSSLEARLIGA